MAPSPKPTGANTIIANLLRPALQPGLPYQPNYDPETWVGAYLAGSSNELQIMAVPEHLWGKLAAHVAAAAFAA